MLPSVNLGFISYITLPDITFASTKSLLKVNQSTLPSYILSLGVAGDIILFGGKRDTHYTAVAIYTICRLILHKSPASDTTPSRNISLLLAICIYSHIHIYIRITYNNSSH